MIDALYEKEKKELAQEARQKHARKGLNNLIDYLIEDFGWENREYGIEAVKDLLRGELGEYKKKNLFHAKKELTVDIRGRGIGDLPYMKNECCKPYGGREK